MPGTDHAGLATQSAVEKALREDGEEMVGTTLGREEFLRRTWEWQKKHGRIIIDQLKTIRLFAATGRVSGSRSTRGYAAAVQGVFVDLHKKGIHLPGHADGELGSEGAHGCFPTKRWNPAPAEESSLYFVKYEVVDQPGRFLEVATTRPGNDHGRHGRWR